MGTMGPTGALAARAKAAREPHALGSHAGSIPTPVIAAMWSLMEVAGAACSLGEAAGAASGGSQCPECPCPRL
jgi:hypothetical protein